MKNKSYSIKKIINFLILSNLKLITIESASCGLLAHIIGSYPNISKFYLGGLITYSAEMKNKMLDISNSKINQFGTISSQIASLMAINAAKKYNADLAISITGNAGPKSIENKLNGLFYIGLFVKDKVYVKKININKHYSRNKKRKMVAKYAIKYLIQKLINTKC